MTGPKLAASSATPAPTDAGANGSIRLPPARTRPVAPRLAWRQAERGEEARERAEQACAAGELPREHAAGIGAGRAQRRAAAADAGGDPAHARRARATAIRTAASTSAATRKATVAVDAPSLGPDADDQRDRDQQRPGRAFAGGLGDERAGEHRAAGLGHPPAQQQHAHRVAAAREDEAAGARAGDPGGDRVAAARCAVVTGRGAHERAPAAAAAKLVGQVQGDAKDQPADGRFPPLAD